MPIRLAQVVALEYDPVHVRLPPDYVGVQQLFRYEMACARAIWSIFGGP